ncbi:hypothetical protein LXL04_009741 [Taraxacum kok-saghyz]
MGCCLGTTAAAAKHRQPDKSKPKLKPKPTPASHSPPPAFEEETVKEVLSETPIVPKAPPPVTVDHPQILHSEERDAVDLTKKPSDEVQENVSEMSEMYSYSESYSAATTATVVDARKDEIEMEEEGEVTQKVKIRSPPAKRVLRKRPMVTSGELAGKNERVTRPAARRQMAPSPEKKRQSPSRTTANVQRNRNVGQPNENRREVMARRSRSPAVRGEAGQRRNTRERSPAEKSRDVMPVKAVEFEEKSPVEKTDDGGALPEPPLTESLENPLVSLECFIFL